MVTKIRSLVDFLVCHHFREEKRLLIDRGIQEAKTMAIWFDAVWTVANYILWDLRSAASATLI